MNSVTLNTDQLLYLESLTDKSEEDLFYEIANNIISPIRASADSKHQIETKGLGFLHRVPSKPISEPIKPFLAPHLDRAKQQVNVMHKRVYSFLCNAHTLKPSDLAMDIATGQIKDVIVSVVTILTVTYSTPMSVAIPIAILLLRNGLQAFCTVNPSA